MVLKKEERGDGQIFILYISNNMEIIQMKKKCVWKKETKHYISCDQIMPSQY